MANIEQGNPYLELKQRTDRDVRQLGPIVTQYYGPVESTDGQTQINLSFAVEQTEVAKKQVLLIIDGKTLTEGAGNDYTYINAANGQSSQILLAAPLAAGLNIQAYRIGVSIQNFPSPATVQATLNNDVAQPNLMAKAGFQNFIEPKYTDAPFTQIQNRAQVLDLTASLGAIVGVERIHTKGLNLLQDEFGPNGERVWEADSEDSRVRFVGSGWTGSSGTSGASPSTATNNDFVEVTFYGTGLNVLLNPGTRDHRATIDGGVEGGNFHGAVSNVLEGRNYSSLSVFNVASGLTLGLHTVKIRNNSSTLAFFGLEIINERTDLAVLAGTAYAGMEREILASISSSAFNAGVSGAKGARVVKYLLDGVISQSVQEVNPSQANLSSADHTNEEIIRRINFREFGANRSDDYSTLTGASTSRAFTLDDGITTVTGLGVLLNNGVGAPDGVIHNNASSVTIITFVGTGLDIIRSDNQAGTQNNNVIIDGSSVGTLSTAGQITPRLEKVVSGLPYGTHTVRIQSAAAAYSFGYTDIIIYGPKKPSIPEGAVEVADYNLMATFVANSTASQQAIATGIVRKQNSREIVYVEGTGGTTNWVLGIDTTNEVSGFSITTDRLNAYTEYTFFGTGVDFRYFGATNRSTNIAVTIDGTSATATNFPTATFSQYGVGSYNTGTAVLSQNGANTPGCGLRISDLPLGKHTIRLNNGTGSTFMSVSSFDVITPVQISNSSLKLSNSINSNRVFTPVKTTVNTLTDLSKAKAWVVYDGVNSKVLNSFNISAVLQSSTGVYIAYFEKPFRNDTYVAIGTPNGGTSKMVTYVEKRYNSIKIQNTTDAGTLEQNFVSMVFFGELIDE